MIVYQADKDAFLRDCNDKEIEEIILASYKAATNTKVSSSEVASWRESLRYVARALNHPSIPASQPASQPGRPQHSNERHEATHNFRASLIAENLRLPMALLRQAGLTIYL